MQKHRITLVVLMLVAIFVISGVAEAILVASKNSEVFHVLTCHFVDSIKEENKVFFDTYQEAVDSGRRPCASCKPDPDDPPPPPVPQPNTPPTQPLPTDGVKIAAFNIQTFGPATYADTKVMGILARIAREFDVLFVQEIRKVTKDIPTLYLAEINKLAGPRYTFVDSEDLGRNQEAYAYFYNTETVCLGEKPAHVWHDPDDVFDREPYIASFCSGNFDFTLVGIHVKLDDAEAEIGNLAAVYDSVLAQNPDERDIIILGDFNADGSYFDEGGASPLKGEDFFWVINNDMDTMTKTDWTYDRIVLTGATFRHEYIGDSAAAFYFDDQYGIDDNPDLVHAVSDHYPVYAVFNTDLPDDDPPLACSLLSPFRSMSSTWGYIKHRRLN